MGLQLMKVLYSESSATEVQVTKGHLKLGAELDHVTHVVLFLTRKLCKIKGTVGFSFTENGGGQVMYVKVRVLSRNPWGEGGIS